MTIRAITDTPSSAPKIIVMTFLKKYILSDLIKNFQIVCLFEMAWSRQYPDADDAFGCINISLLHFLHSTELAHFDGNAL